MNSAIVVAAGKASRFGQDKMLVDIDGYPLIYRTLQAFIGCDAIHEIIVVVNTNNKQRIEELFSDEPKVFITLGGENRVESVNAGLRLVNRRCDFVVIHDGARPYVTQALLKRVLDVAIKSGSGCAIPYVYPVDTIYMESADGANVVERESLMRVQTPQCFDYQKLCIAYYNAMRASYTDDSQVYRSEYGKLDFVEGDPNNVKVTYPSDVKSIRIGNGVDSHRLVAGRDLILGGVKIPYELGLLGHSDADVLVHAVMDAILSAVGERDIGVLFPDTDPQYKDISSLALLRKVMKTVQAKGRSVKSVSAVIVCEKPKLSEYIPQMCACLSSVVGVPLSCVSISATTTEGMGIIGNGEGIGCMAVCLAE
ncbi:MAG: 2-C-methyl-D-erythritol 2,4-cyclodiphosphate synthase [Clostridia bacterium]|nr:2-C-methyl-D-erythritol 2,4-cyclodiphosphate synthase [Clostridia bacterium]